MRERLLSSVCCRLRRYTLTYNEGTMLPSPPAFRRAIHPHIQWGNCLSRSTLSRLRDTPSHAVREPYHSRIMPIYHRYTLTCSEGTSCVTLNEECYPIHPHMQWGNPCSPPTPCRSDDTPSHTVREPASRRRWRANKRYTLTYSEGTAYFSLRHPVFPIYPHIQWGNIDSVQNVISVRDTPSHTVRELYNVSTGSDRERYTLTYSEGTPEAALSFLLFAIHPHIQWGNDISFKQLNHINDTPSHTVREHSVFTRFSAAPNTSLCNLHKSLLSSSSHL